MEEMNAKGVTLKAMEQFRLKTCIDFKPKDSEDYYISVKKLSGYVLSFLFVLFSSFSTNCASELLRLSEVCVGQKGEMSAQC